MSPDRPSEPAASGFRASEEPRPSLTAGAVSDARRVRTLDSPAVYFPGLRSTTGGGPFGFVAALPRALDLRASSEDLP